MTHAAAMLTPHILTVDAVTARLAVVTSKGVWLIMALALQPRRCGLYPTLNNSNNRLRLSHIIYDVLLEQ